MKELNAKQEKFYNQWKVRRTKKFSYIFLHGTVFWGIPTGLLFFLLESHFNRENMDLFNFILSLFVFSIGGLFFGLSQYKQIDNTYLYLNDDKKILDGIRILETGKVWNYENLIIKREDNTTLVVKNNLFWFEDANALSENLEECLNIVLKDFERLKKNPDFDVFSSEYKVKAQVYNNSEKEKPLIEINM
ncbi:MAG: hypothetical protein Q8861_10190 [Bacteroidota bacterium]|nr:hypothetical protein [Bacteroidota bacterium]